MVPQPIPRTPRGASSAPSFLQLLPTDGMRAMLHYWVFSRHGTAMPRRPPFDPLHFPDLLSLLQLHERKAEGRYLCRVSGTEVVAAFGYESTGRHLDELVLPPHRAARIAIFNRCLNDGLPLFYDGRLMAPERDWKCVQRLLLPLADERGTPRFLLSLLHFEPLQTVMPSAPDEEHGILALRAMTAFDIDHCIQQSTP